jgi:hypothetical protein
MTTWITPAPSADTDLGRWLVLARERGGRSWPAQILDLWRLSRMSGRLEADEYYAYRLYDTTRDRSSFVGRRRVAHLLGDVVRSPWPALASDQLAVRAMLSGFGLPVPELLAVWSPRRHTGVPTWRNDMAARDGLLALDEPAFIKPVDASNSSAVLSVDRVVDGRLVLADGRTAAIDEVVQQLSARAQGAGVQIQRRLVPHPTVAAVVGPRIATVRLLWLVGEGGPRLHRAAWRLPVGLSPCDAPWRPGNVLAGINPETGVVVSASRGLGPDRRDVTTHADTGMSLIGTTVPGWTELVATSRAAAEAVSWCPIQAWDLALTEAGPVIVELEGDGGAPYMTQLPFERGWVDASWRTLETALISRAQARDRAKSSWWSTVRETWRRAREA